MADKLTKKQRSYCMSRIKSKNTKIEMLLRKILFAKGLRYRIHYKKLPGVPDIVFLKEKIVVFVDGDFWHGRNFVKRKHAYNDYWKNKILRNIERAKEVNRDLNKLGYKVIRIWGNDLKKESEQYGKKIERLIKGYKYNV